ncbi:hypothetical protein HDU81_002168 [Chytriomyces hyalinus]|nr:hypothetical protein HDU81_002168 [Chytriomyces hyalinus]
MLSTGTEQMSDPDLNRLAIIIYVINGVMVLCSLLLLAAIAHFIVTHEHSGLRSSLQNNSNNNHHNSRTKDAATTSAVPVVKRSKRGNPFSTLLFIMILSNIVLFVCNSIRVSCSDKVYLITTIFMDVFNFTGEICYMSYAWYRGSAILMLSFPSLTLPVKTTMFLLPVASAGQVICDLLKSIDLIPPTQPAGRWFAIGSGTLIVLYDLLITIAFAHYLYTCRSSDTGVALDSERFRIIAQHGIVSSSLLLLSLTLYVCAGLLAKSRLTIVLLLSIVYTVFFCVAVVLFRMKVVLHQEKVGKESMRVTRLEEVLGGDEVRRIQTSSALHVNQTQLQSSGALPVQCSKVG